MNNPVPSKLNTAAHLASLQQWMQQCLVSPNSDQAAEASHWINDNARQTAQQRLAIYQRSYYARLLNCLAEQFPALCHALGKPLFYDFGKLYLHACPSDSYTLYDLGRRFPAYLQSTRPDLAVEGAEPETWIDFMCDLASFESQVFSLFDASGAENQQLATLETPNHALQLQPCFALGEYQFDVASYYHQVRQQQQPKLPDIAHTCIAFVRKDYLTHTLPISPAQYQFLQLLQQGMDVESALARTAQVLNIGMTQLEDTWNRTQGTRERWVGVGMFVDGRSNLYLNP